MPKKREQAEPDRGRLYSFQVVIGDVLVDTEGTVLIVSYEARTRFARAYFFGAVPEKASWGCEGRDAQRIH